MPPPIIAILKGDDGSWSLDIIFFSVLTTMENYETWNALLPVVIYRKESQLYLAEVGICSTIPGATTCKTGNG